MRSGPGCAGEASEGGPAHGEREEATLTIRTVIRTGVRASALAATLLVAGGAAAQSPTSAQQQALRASCQSDFRANCSGVSPGGQAALACLQKNVAKLSAACQSAVNAIGGAPAAATPKPAAPAPAATAPAAAPATATPATAPATTAPAPKTPSKPATAAAPKPAKPPVGTPPPVAAPAAPPPTVIVLSPRQEIVLVRRFCGADVRAFCQGVPLGRGNIATCLAANMPRLSPGCRGALTR